jgi:RNA polymerase sigma factor (sigma-70 family)
MGDVLRLPAGCRPEDLPDPGANTEESVLFELDAQRLRRLLDALPESEHRVLRWHYGLDGEPIPLRDIAERLGVSLGTAHNIEQRALAILRGQWLRVA